MPFYEGIARYEGDVVEVEDLGWLAESVTAMMEAYS
jgi:hypothetical protein